MTLKTTSSMLVLILAIIFIACLWAYAYSQPRTVGIYVTIGGPLTRVTRGGPSLLVLQVLRGRKLRLNVEDVDERTLPSKLKLAASNTKFVRAVYIAADTNEPTGEVIRAIDLVKKIDATLPVALITPSMEREAPPLQ
jgi:biopolymer transport protein ExbD